MFWAAVKLIYGPYIIQINHLSTIELPSSKVIMKFLPVNSTSLCITEHDNDDPLPSQNAQPTAAQQL